MKRLGSFFLLLSLLGSGFTILTPATAHADTPGCVTYSEYNALRAGDTQTRINRLFDTSGYEVDRRVEYGYWDDQDFWIEDHEWGDRHVDFVRSYKKCRSFDGGSGRVGIWYDNYSHGYGAGNRVWTKTRYNPMTLVNRMHEFWDSMYWEGDGWRVAPGTGKR